MLNFSVPIRFMFRAIQFDCSSIGSQTRPPEFKNRLPLTFATQNPNPMLTASSPKMQTLKNALKNNPLYSELNRPESLRHFMESHVYAVWDFMSLLTYLQSRLTCTQIPWMPVGDPEVRHLINEIVKGEESDEMPGGGYISHFELYLKAMEQAGANTDQLALFLNEVRQGKAPENSGNLPKGVAEFLKFTFNTIRTDRPHEVAAVFTWGREDLIPTMFGSMVHEMNEASAGKFSLYLYYLERHIEIDGDHHSHLSHKMVQLLCENDPEKWEQALQAAENALEARLSLWNSILSGLKA